MKTIKIMDIFFMINCNEEVPYKIRYNSVDYTYDSDTQDYWNGDRYLFEKLFGVHDTSNVLETEVEILDEEDEFEDIEVTGWALPVTELEKHFGDKINALIKNQKKIIERLKEE